MTKIKEDYKRKTKSCKSYNVSGLVEVNKLRERRRAREEKEQNIAIYKAKRQLTLAVNRAKNVLKHRGINTRKAKKARKEQVELL